MILCETANIFTHQLSHPQLIDFVTFQPFAHRFGEGVDSGVSKTIAKRPNKSQITPSTQGDVDF